MRQDTQTVSVIVLKKWDFEKVLAEVNEADSLLAEFSLDWHGSEASSMWLCDGINKHLSAPDFCARNHGPSTKQLCSVIDSPMREQDAYGKHKLEKDG